MEDQDEHEYREYTHVGRGRVEPAEVGPVLGGELQWGELENGSLQFPPSASDLLDALPSKLPDFEFPTQQHPDKDATPIAKQHVKEESVPPALVKIRKNVRKEKLSALPHDTDGPQNAHMPNQEGFENPPYEMGGDKYVHSAVEVSHSETAVHCVELCAVRIRVAELWIKPIE